MAHSCGLHLLRLQDINCYLRVDDSLLGNFHIYLFVNLHFFRSNMSSMKIFSSFTGNKDVLVLVSRIILHIIFLIWICCSYGMDLNGARRKNATRETTSTLKAWLNEHKKNPYPTKGEKIMLAIITKMTLTQVSTWFANARRRLKKENKMTWEPRNRVEDEDNNNEDDDSGRKSVDEKDRLGESCFSLNNPPFLQIILLISHRVNHYAIP